MLVVSREPSALAPLGAISEANAWQLETAGSGWEALERMQSEVAPDLVVLDLAREDSDGLHTLRWLRRVRPDIPVLVISHPDDSSKKLEAIRLGAQGCVVRPIDQECLQSAILRQLSLHQSRPMAAADEVEAMGDDMYFVAASRLMRKLRTQAEMMAQVNVPLLIVGERGSGKETVARFIHRLSVRSASPFVKVNCAALPGDVLEKELFGYERNAFGGAARTKPGKLGQCDKGTIFLEEFTEMPGSLQARLLQVLQEKQSLRSGTDSSARPDVRIFAATHVDVEQALAEGKLREDLYYRLSGFSVHVPALRERREEVPLLLGYFMNRLARRYALQPRNFSPAALSACQFYSWPGNLTEVESFVKRYLASGDELQSIRELDIKRGRILEPAFPSAAPTEEGNGGGNGHAEEHESSLKSLVQSVKGEAERNAISSALDTTHWNRKAAARLLQVSYRTLLYKIQQYHMTPPATYLAPPGNGNGIKIKGNGNRG